MTTAESITLSDLELTRLLFVIIILLVSSHFFGFLFNKYKLPRVIGEIFGGLLLGPTFLGSVFPEVHSWLFNSFEGEGKLISIIYWFGLIMLMFISGFEIQKTINSEDKKIISAILLGATVIPFLAGWFAPVFFDFTPYIGYKENMLALKIVIAIAVAVTSIPVISKIFIDLNIMNTYFAKIVLASATLQDIILWIALAVATGLVSTETISLSYIIMTIIITIAFFLVSLLIMPKVIRYSNGFRYNFLIKSSVSGYVLFICFLFTALASLLKVNIVFGAFLAGVIIGLVPKERFEKQKVYIKEISLGFFIPIYFAIVGLKLDLIHHFDAAFFFGFLIFTTFFETFGTLLTAKIIKKDWLSSFNLAVAMNTRGGPGIVLATVAFDLGIINETFFVTLVLIAIVTSLIAGFWLRIVQIKKWAFLKPAD